MFFKFLPVIRLYVTPTKKDEIYEETGIREDK